MRKFGRAEIRKVVSCLQKSIWNEQNPESFWVIFLFVKCLKFANNKWETFLCFKFNASKFVLVRISSTFRFHFIYNLSATSSFLSICTDTLKLYVYDDILRTFQEKLIKTDSNFSHHATPQTGLFCCVYFPYVQILKQFLHSLHSIRYTISLQIINFTALSVSQLFFSSLFLAVCLPWMFRFFLFLTCLFVSNKNIHHHHILFESWGITNELIWRQRCCSFTGNLV